MLHHLRLTWRKRASLGLVCALAVSLLVACGGREGTNGEGSSAQSGTPAAASGTKNAPDAGADKETARTVKDELGHEVALPASPKRIFAPYLEDSLLTLGIKPVAQWSNGQSGLVYLQEELKGVPMLDMSGGFPSPEALLSHNPDLIILHTAAYAANGGYEKYSKIAPTFTFNNASGDTKKSLVALGELLGKTAEAEQALKAYDQKVKEAKEKLPKTTAGQKIGILRFAPRGVSLMGVGHLAGYVVHQDLGIATTTLLGKESNINVSMEVLPQLDADYLFFVNQYGQGTERMKEMTESPLWQSVPAVKKDQVHEVSDEHWLGSGLIAYGKMIDDTVRLLVK
ncbi:iron-siderophore ABC transporter substrate-binding protein [Paenibacillus sp. GYB004]|uniref:iron-siderophore ABC transporter substrate-binding protein n=1 Tax=Paenibacillus sp. GYB004 TaxID=2994393 RepID=UPI002F960E84